MKKYKLIALDMDGTLLTSDKKVHPDTVRDIAYAAGQGLHVVYCSGRTLVELRPYEELLPDIRFAVSTSGSEVYDFHEKKYVFRKSIPLDLARKIVSLIGEQAGMLQFLTDGVSIIRDDVLDHMEGITEMALDLADVEYVSSAGLRALLQIHKDMSKQGKLKLLNINTAVKEIFGMIGFLRIFTIE